MPILTLQSAEEVQALLSRQGPSGLDLFGPDIKHPVQFCPGCLAGLAKCGHGHRRAKGESMIFPDETLPVLPVVGLAAEVVAVLAVAPDGLAVGLDPLAGVVWHSATGLLSTRFPHNTLEMDRKRKRKLSGFSQARIAGYLWILTRKSSMKAHCSLF
jgi:hypothetical protein